MWSPCVWKRNVTGAAVGAAPYAGQVGENGPVFGSGERFWGGELDVDERALVEHLQGPIELEPDALVVGGGIMGVTTALALQVAAIGSVQLIEASTLASGATGGLSWTAAA
jgi:hypothetical protein